MMRKGACLYCGQIRMIEEDDMLRAVMEGVEAGERSRYSGNAAV